MVRADVPGMALQHGTAVTMFILAQIAHLLAAAVAAGCILAGYRWIRSQSSALGMIVALAVLTRVACGLALFWISYLQLPIARGLQVPGGFWQVALDATGYYQFAAAAATRAALYPIDYVVPSPIFVNTLAVWMMAFGISPATGMFLNLCLYVGCALMLVWAFEPVNNARRDLPCIVALVAYSYSPVIVLHSTQPLKDELTNALLVGACLGVLGMRRTFPRRVSRSDAAAVAAGAAVIAAAVFGLSGIRFYYGLMLWCSLAVALGLCGAAAASGPRYLIRCAPILLVAWVGFWGGSGPHYRLIGTNLDAIIAWQPPRSLRVAEFSRAASELRARIATVSGNMMNFTKLSRNGFQVSGGGSNVVVPLRDDPAVGLSYERRLEETQRKTAFYREQQRQQQPSVTSPAAAAVNHPARLTEEQALAFRALPMTPRDHAMATIRGIGFIFLPLSFMKATVGVAIPGGHGFLSAVDLDTLFQDATLLTVIVMLWRRRAIVGDRFPVIVFAMIISAVTATLLGYVVTNFGTLWRMRSLVAVPIWATVIALSPRRESNVPSAVVKPLFADGPDLADRNRR